jgi:hypothetical protein
MLSSSLRIAGRPVPYESLKLAISNKYRQAVRHVLMLKQIETEPCAWSNHQVSIVYSRYLISFHATEQVWPRLMHC